MKVLMLLLLSLQGYAEGMNNCGEDTKLKRFRVTKGDQNYNLELCISIDNISLHDEQGLPGVCDYCSKISGSRLGNDCNDLSACVGYIDSFFSDHCKNVTFDQYAISSVTPFTPNSITPTVCTNVITKIITERVEITHTPSVANTCAPVSALGAVAGLFLVILVLVVTGWVWTCWTMKKRKNETKLCKNCQEQESEEERFCPNQLYEMTTTEPVVGTAIEQLLHSQEESGQNNNGLSSKDNKGYHDVKREENFYTNSEGSSHSSLQKEQAVNRVEEGESGEKHVYHVLEKPGGSDYEDPDKDLEEDTIMEYETPVPLN